MIFTDTGTVEIGERFLGTGLGLLLELMKTTPFVIFPRLLLVETVCDKLHYVPGVGEGRGGGGR